MRRISPGALAGICWAHAVPRCPRAGSRRECKTGAAAPVAIVLVASAANDAHFWRADGRALCTLVGTHQQAEHAQELRTGTCRRRVHEPATVAQSSTLRSTRSSARRGPSGSGCVHMTNAHRTSLAQGAGNQAARRHRRRRNLDTIAEDRRIALLESLAHHHHRIDAAQRRAVPHTTLYPRVRASKPARAHGPATQRRREITGDRPPSAGYW